MVCSLSLRDTTDFVVFWLFIFKHISLDVYAEIADAAIFRSLQYLLFSVSMALVNILIGMLMH